jgi:hypothetical protein
MRLPDLIGPDRLMPWAREMVRVLGLGLAEMQAQKLQYSTFFARRSTAVITPAGTTIGSAAVIPADVTVLGTCTTLENGAQLPGAQPGRHVVVINAGGTAATIYPASGEQIETLGTGSGLSLAAGARGLFWVIDGDATGWRSLRGTF